MSRSGYCCGEPDDQEQLLALYRYRGQVASAARGRRGQRMLRAMKAALEAMPDRKLVRHEIQCEDGMCAFGALAAHQGVDVSDLDPDDPEVADDLAERFDVAPQLACEVVHMNDDELGGDVDDYARWLVVYRWVCRQIRPAGESS